MTITKESRRTPGGHLTYYAKRTPEERRSVAQAREITGEYKALAILVRELMGWYSGGVYMSARQAAKKTGVNHSSLAGMSRGDRGSYESICKFASGFGIDPSELLAAAGYFPKNTPVGEAETLQPDIIKGLSQENARLLERLERFKEDRDFLQKENNDLRKELAIERGKLRKIVSLAKGVEL